MNRDVEAFLSKKEEEKIVDAIRTAERKTSGEIRVHIEPTAGKMDIFDRVLSLKIFPLAQQQQFFRP